MIDEWASIPYRDYGRDAAGADCWGLVRIIRKAVRGDTLDCLLYLDPGDATKKHASYENLVESLIESEPAEGAIVFCFSGALCIHAGIILTVDGRQCVVDTTSRTGVRITPLQRYKNIHRIKIYDTRNLPVAP